MTLPLLQGMAPTFVFTLDPDNAAGNHVTWVSAYRRSQFIGDLSITVSARRNPIRRDRTRCFPEKANHAKL